MSWAVNIATYVRILIFVNFNFATKHITIIKLLDKFVIKKGEISLQIKCAIESCDFLV